MNRYRLLYFIVSKKRIKDRPGLKANLIKLFEYKSDGHFYTDWDFLLNEKFIESKDGYIVATDRAKQEFSFLLWSKVTAILSTIIGIVLLIYFSSSILGVQLSIYGIYASSITLIAFGIGLYKVIYKFVPSLPTKDKIKSSNL
jgi:hypothetical protein